MSSDPINAGISTGLNFNRYWYANNNPNLFVDPDGRAAVVKQPGFCAMVRVCLGDNDNWSSPEDRSSSSGESMDRDDKFNTSAFDKLYRSAQNAPEANEFLKALLFSEDSPLSIEYLLKAGTYTRVATDATEGGIYGKFSYRYGNFSVSASILKNGDMVNWSFSLSDNFSYKNVQLGYGLNLKKLVPFLGRQIGLEFIEADGAAVRGARALRRKTRDALIEADPENSAKY